MTDNNFVANRSIRIFCSDKITTDTPISKRIYIGDASNRESIFLYDSPNFAYISAFLDVSYRRLSQALNLNPPKKQDIL